MAPNTLYDLLLEAAGRHGSHTAIEFGDRRLTYDGLRDAADRLAGLLIDRDVGSGQCVAFCFRKSIDAIIALFAIIRTGATYVPLDPAWPADRLSTICEDADIRLWLGTAPPPAGVAGAEAAIVSAPDSSNAVRLASWESHDPAGQAPEPPRDGLANILYTSGSTGRPKGVRITTRSLLHLSEWAVDTFDLSPADRMANHAPYNFDISTLDIFGAVRAGATMCPVPESTRMFPYQTAKFIADRRITVWYSVPSALIMMQLRGSLPEHDLSSLRHVLFAGEVMPKPALKAIAQAIPQATPANLFGPTETNVCTWHRVEEADLCTDTPLPIGRPIRQTRIWIMNEQGVPVDQGQAGELWVAGPTVTDGYFGDAALTASRLVPAPDGSGRAYRTGDRVRARADGVLLFEGRIDRMIKCRGHRIEPGEVEAVLLKHPEIREAAVVPVPDPVFGNRLRACVALGEGCAPDERAFREFCGRHLPVYMLPDEWAFFDSLPRTDRDKVDLQRLMR
ncbi:MAG: amino acid adenylation domain-containing protein [Phycisphaerae bacterium]